MIGSDLIDLARVDRWMASHVQGYRGPLSAKKTASGQSNPTFILSAPSGRYVLRRQPPGQLLKSAHAVDREYRVMHALAETGLPVPGVFALCTDRGILGAMFFVMELLPGTTFGDPRCPGASNEMRARIYDDMNKALARLHCLDPVALGLADYGRPGNYFARQISRWEGQYRLSETESIPDMEDLLAWLLENVPGDDGRVALVHGDWRIDNLLFDKENGKLTGVLDWELSTLGNPLADLGAQIMQWAMPVGKEGRGLEGVDRQALSIPEDDGYLELYADRAGLSDVPDMRFPVAFSFFRMAAILQGVKKRAIEGNASDPASAMRLSAYIPILAQRALQRL